MRDLNSIQERFWQKVDLNGPIPPYAPGLGSCWMWTACIGTGTKGGYGQFRVGLQIKKAHRLSYEWLNGPIPEELELDHLCRVRSCVRPSHLEAVTLITNQRRGFLGERNRQKTHCPQGHPYDGANTRASKVGQRLCKECHRLREHNRRHPYELASVAAQDESANGLVTLEP